MPFLFSKTRTEDQVRDDAQKILGFDEAEDKIRQGTGQITTFNQLGFIGVNRKPDGWYLPDDRSMPAIILETKSEKEDLENPAWEKELFDNIDIANSQYEKVIGILYNGIDIRVYKLYDKVDGLSKQLQRKEYYLSIYNRIAIDKKAIYSLTKKINDTLHIRFGIKNLYHRMIFTACALVATKEGATLAKGMDYNDFHNSILNQINKSLKDSKKRNVKLQLLADIYTKIEMNSPDNAEAIDDFIGWVKEISGYVTSDSWNGEDVMGIFFNEFNRYKAKSENGQIFTPDHITSIMYRLIHCDMNDKILDATCGSGAFLVKAMCNMIKEAGGINTPKADLIKEFQLFGIEWDKEIYALACANMLIHKDGKTNLEQMDSRSEEVCRWIKSKGITKVLMNPPYEKKYGCMQIVSNVLNNVPVHTECAFILPDKKLEKDYTDKTYGNKLLRNHTLKKIIKLPENLFINVGATTSIFIFEAGVPQNNKAIFACYIEDDGLETVKNQGRQDVKGKWQSIEDKWVKIIDNPVCDEAKTVSGFIQSVDPKYHLSYQMPEKEFEISETDFIKTAMDYEMFKRGINAKEFSGMIADKVLYSSELTKKDNTIYVAIKKGGSSE